MKKILLLLLVPFVSNAQIDGHWFSSFSVMGQPLEMEIDIVTGAKSSITLYDITHGGTMQCDTFAIADSTLFFQWSQGMLKYTGTRQPDGSIAGKMSQSGLKWEAILTRDKQEVAVINHWQEPKAPFPYTADSLQIPNGDIVLGATLVLPEGWNETTPFVVFASGTGPQNRDSEILGHRSFAVIADHLARNGIGSLRFDDRQTGTSTGSYGTAGLSDFGSDVETCVRYLRKDRKFSKNPIGILGHSEGGIHALIAASNYKKIDFLIQFAAIAGPAKQTLIDQQYEIPIASGATEEEARWNQQLFVGMSNILASVPEAQAADSLMEFVGRHYDRAPASFDSKSLPRQSFIFNNVAFMNNAWGREFVAFDATPILKKLHMPILAIHGDRDLQVNAATNSAAFAQFETAECHIFPGLNHLGQHCETCTVDEYGNLEETVAPEILELISTWVLRQK